MRYFPSNWVTESLRNLFQRRIGDSVPAYLGDKVGTGARVDVPGRTGYVYVRLQRNSPPFMARSGDAAYPNYPGAPVYIAYRYNSEVEIVGTNYKALDSVGIDSRVLNPLNQQSRWVYPYQLTYGLASAVATTVTDSFLVTVKKFRHYVANTLQAFETPLAADKIDLSAYVPAAGQHCYAAVWIDTFLNEAVVTTSVAQATSTPLDDTDLQELVVRAASSRPPDATPLKAFYLANAQGTLRQSALEVDLRLWLYNPPAWGFPNVLSTLERVWPNRTLIVGPYTTTGIGDLDTSESGAQVIIVHQNNFTGMTAPTITDDSDSGYSVGSLWYDAVTHLLYMASDVSVGAAVWQDITIQQRTIASSTDPGTPGEMAADNNFFCRCIATDTWARIAFDATPW
jgi:hypothetical protein